MSCIDSINAYVREILMFDTSLYVDEPDIDKAMDAIDDILDSIFEQIREDVATYKRDLAQCIIDEMRGN